MVTVTIVIGSIDMKEVERLTNLFHGPIYHVTSEPGDGTRYEYFAYRDGPDELCIMPANSPMRYPQRLNYYEYLELDAKSITNEANKQNCNPYTLLECIRTMKELHSGKYT
jgi:predicted transcriptional regulator